MTFRPDIEGLRCLAVVFVIAFHCGVPGFSGGFIGVDVFFVLSGYLITGLLVSEFERTSRINLIQFYARRLRRLLPASALTLLVTLAMGAIVLAPYELEFAARAARASALYMSNIFFAREAADYFSPKVETNPILHTWSLAVEEQFYVFWPLLLLLGLKIGRSRKALVATLSLLTASSLFQCVWQTAHSGPLAFYELPSRAWEFGLGGVAVLIPRAVTRVFLSKVWRTMSWIGLVTIIGSAAWLISPQSTFPGWIALVPVVGTLGVLISMAEQPASGAGFLLGLAPVQAIGKLSYSWYLWHWPALVFATALFPNITVPGKVITAIGALVTAALANRFVENPIRYHPRLVGAAVRSIYLGAALTACTLAGAFLTLWIAKQLANEPAMKAITAASEDIADMPRQQCVSLAESADVKTCMFGNLSSPMNIALFGDSHAIQWFNPLRRMAEARGWKLTTFVKSGCPAADVTPPGSSAGFEVSCSQWRSQAIRMLLARHPSLILMGNSTIYVGIAGGMPVAQWVAGFKRTLEATGASGLPITVMRDNPHATFDVPTCLARSLRHSWYPGGRCEMRKSAALNPAIFEAEEAGAAAMPNVRFLDLTDQFCQGDVCSAMRDGQVMYRDDNHLTGHFAASLEPVLAARILPLLPAAWH